MYKFLSVFLLMGLWTALCSQGINADIRTYTFSQGKASYLEVVYFIPTAHSERIYDADSSFHQEANLTLVLRQGDKIIQAEKYHLIGPISKEDKPLLHCVRMAIKPGNYEIESILSEGRTGTHEISQINKCTIPPPTDGMGLSDIQLFANYAAAGNAQSPFCKNGIQFELLPYQILGRTNHVLTSYVEVYHMDLYNAKNYILRYQIWGKDSLSKDIKKDEWFKYKDVSDPGIILNRRDVSALASGTYSLVISVLRRDTSVVAQQKIEFERYNPFWDRLIELHYENPSEETYFSRISNDSIHYYLRALNVILPSSERDVLASLDHGNRIVEKKMYLYRFWRDHFGSECVSRFERFKKNVLYADRQFVSGFRYGFESDRGVTHLMYGVPQEIIREDNDNGAFPYEIWMYDKLASGQSNVRFLFYNPDLTGTNYLLLHTNCYGGRFNSKWELELYRKVKDEYDGDNPVDATRIKKSVNRRAREYFEK